jgi:hypothetical protein
VTGDILMALLGVAFTLACIAAAHSKNWARSTVRSYLRIDGEGDTDSPSFRIQVASLKVVMWVGAAFSIAITAFGAAATVFAVMGKALEIGR